jgi:hypothetical protein
LYNFKLLKGKEMATGKTEVTAKKIAMTKTPAIEKKAAKPVVKRAAKKPANAAPETAAKKPKRLKAKVVRDFSMPQVEYEKISEIKEMCLKAGLRVKRSEVLRAGLKALGEMNGAQIKRAIGGLAKMKIDTPKKL